MSLPPGVPQRFESDRLKMPGMQPEETLVWREWLALFEHLYDAYDYNTRIGAGDVPPNVTNEATVRDAKLNSQLRMDVVGWQGVAGFYSPQGTYRPQEVYAQIPNARATIFEIKRRAATAATNGIISYGHLWAHEFGQYPPPARVIVAATYSPTIQPVLNREGIKLTIVAVDFASLSPRYRPK